MNLEESKDKVKKVLLLMGQHRSGSSVFTGMLEIFGAYLGRNIEMSPNKWNEKGYFENRDLYVINEKLLTLLRSSWDDCSEVNYDAISKEQREEQVKRIKSTIIKDVNNSETGLFVAKDPRISILLPFYLEALKDTNIEVELMFTTRSDREIIDSLERRNKFNRSKTLKLIDKHERYAKENAKDMNITYHNFENLFYDTKKYFSQLNSMMNLNLNINEKTIKKAEGLLEKKLKHHNSDKNCKIIATYFGPRRNKPNGIEQSINFWESKVLKFEYDIDPGVQVDNIVVNHHFGNEKVEKFLEKIDGRPTRRGIIKVYNREWEEGVGGSFLSFGRGFEKFKKDYKYWFFTEDNVIMIRKNYYKIALSQLKKNIEKKVAFICCMRSTALEKMPEDKKWCHGGCGLTTRERLEEIHEELGCLPHSKMKIPKHIEKKIFEDDLTAFKIKTEINTTDNSWYREFCQEGEIQFTNQFFIRGYKLMEIVSEEKVVMWHEYKY